MEGGATRLARARPRLNQFERAPTRLVAILGALCAVAAVSRLKSFDAFREKLERALTTEEDETEAVGTVSLWGRRHSVQGTRARWWVDGNEAIDRRRRSCARRARDWGSKTGDVWGLRVGSDGEVDDSHAYVGVAGYWWGPFPSFNRAKRAERISWTRMDASSRTSRRGRRIRGDVTR